MIPPSFVGALPTVGLRSYPSPPPPLLAYTGLFADPGPAPDNGPPVPPPNEQIPKGPAAVPEHPPPPPA